MTNTIFYSLCIAGYDAGLWNVAFSLSSGKKYTVSDIRYKFLNLMCSSSFKVEPFGRYLRSLVYLYLLLINIGIIYIGEM